MEGGLHIDPKVASSQEKKNNYYAKYQVQVCISASTLQSKIISRNTKKLIIEVNLKAKAL